jgi:hypothetical protein
MPEIFDGSYAANTPPRTTGQGRKLISTQLLSFKRLPRSSRTATPSALSIPGLNAGAFRADG